MPTVSVNSVDLYYEERGGGDPILCIHGTSSSAKVWEGAAEELARLGRVISYDRRGCTRSQRPEPYLTTTVSEHGDDAAALLGALSATPAIVIGRSYGGEIAIDLALRYPELVRALVVLEGPVLPPSPESRRWWDELTEQVFSAAAARGIHTVAEVLLRGVLGDAAWEEFPDELKRMFTDNGPAILAEVRGGDMEVGPAVLTTIRQPTLLVTATDSPAALREIHDAMAAALPHARTVLVPGGHMINPAEPAVLDFIREVLAAEGALTPTRG